MLDEVIDVPKFLSEELLATGEDWVVETLSANMKKIQQLTSI